MANLETIVNPFLVNINLIIKLTISHYKRFAIYLLLQIGLNAVDTGSRFRNTVNINFGKC